jgi:hypothetical protein
MLLFAQEDEFGDMMECLSQCFIQDIAKHMNADCQASWRGEPEYKTLVRWPSA